MNIPVNPSFTIKKWGVRGYTLHRLVIMMMFGRIMTLGCRAERGRKPGQDLVWFGLMLVPVNNFSVMLGRSRRFLCITSMFGV